MFRRWLLMLILAVSFGLADEKPRSSINYFPMDYLNLQYAGNIGMLSLGVGNLFLDGHYALELYYGYTPRQVSEVAVSTIAIKNNYNPFRLRLAGHDLEPYIGLGLLYSFNQRYNPNWKDEVPDDYYYQYAFHFTGYGGLSVMHPLDDAQSPIQSFGAYVEVGTVDAYLIDYFSDDNALSLDDIFSIALGLRMRF